MKHDVENDNISGREQDALEEEEEVVEQECREGGTATGLGRVCLVLSTLCTLGGGP